MEKHEHPEIRNDYGCGFAIGWLMCIVIMTSLIVAFLKIDAIIEALRVLQAATP